MWTKLKPYRTTLLVLGGFFLLAFLAGECRERYERSQLCAEIAVNLLRAELTADRSAMPDALRGGAREGYNDLAERGGCPSWQEIAEPDR